MRMGTLRFVKMFGGMCCIRVGSDAEIERYVGQENIMFIRKATKKDVEWVTAMGGFVPDGRIEEEATCR